MADLRAAFVGLFPSKRREKARLLEKARSAEARQRAMEDAAVSVAPLGRGHFALRKTAKSG